VAVAVAVAVAVEGSRQQSAVGNAAGRGRKT